MANNIVEEIFRIKSDTAQIIKELQTVKGVYQELTKEQAEQVVQLGILEQKEKSLLEARKKSTNPTMQIRLTNEIKANTKEIEKLRIETDKFTVSEHNAAEEANALALSLKNAFSQTQINAVKQTASAFNPLNNSVNQLSRELPAFAVSAQVGFLAISNNLPVFFDALARINAENAQLAKTGAQGASVLKQLGSAIFSVGTLLSIGVTLLTVYGAKIFETIGGLFKQREEFELNTEALKDYNAEIEASVKNQDEFLKRISATAIEIIRLREQLTDTQGDNLSALSKFQDEFDAIEERRKKAVTKIVIDQLRAGDEQLKIAATVKDGMIQIKNEETDELIKLSADSKQLIAANTFFGKESLTQTEAALRAKLEVINKNNKREIDLLELAFKEEQTRNYENEQKKKRAKAKADAEKIKAEIDLRDRIRQLAIDATKDEEQREIEQVRFDNEKAKREVAKLQVDEHLKGQARLDAIRRLEAQKAELQIALDKDLFIREEKIREKFQKETDDKIRDDFKRTIDARIEILNENKDFELFLLEDKLAQEREKNKKADADEIKRLKQKILDKKIEILQDKAEQEKVGKNAAEILAIETKLEHDIAKLRAVRDKDDKQHLKDRLKSYIDYFAEIVHAAIDATNKILAAKIKEVDGQISQQERRVAQAKEIADRGNAELVELEEKRLTDLTRKREKYVRDQQALAAVELIANTAITVSKAAAQGGVAAGVTIAAALIALVAGLASARSIASQAAFYDGGYTGDGSPSDVSNTMGGKSAFRNYTWHKGEFVMDHENTRNFRDIFEDVHAGRINLREWKDKVSAYDQMVNYKTFNTSNPVFAQPQINNIIQFKELEGQMSEVNKTLRALKLGLNVDEEGFTTFIQKRFDRRQFIDHLARHK